MGAVKYLVFKTDERSYAIELSHVNGTEQDYNVRSIPEAPFGIIGVINLRGSIVPVYSLRKRFGKNPKITDPFKSLLIARTSGIMIAYEVDSVVSIAEVDESDIRQMPQMASNEDTLFMDKVIQVDNKIIVVIDVNKLLSGEEIEMLERLMEKHAEADKKALEEKHVAESAAKEKLAKSAGKE